MWVESSIKHVGKYLLHVRVAQGVNSLAQNFNRFIGLWALVFVSLFCIFLDLAEMVVLFPEAALDSKKERKSSSGNNMR